MRRRLTINAEAMMIIVIWVPEESTYPTGARQIIDLGRSGGVIVGTHSVSPEIPLDHFVAYHETCLTYGRFSRRV